MLNMLMFISAPVDDWNSNTELAFPDDGEFVWTVDGVTGAIL